MKTTNPACGAKQRGLGTEPIWDAGPHRQRLSLLCNHAGPVIDHFQTICVKNVPSSQESESAHPFGPLLLKKSS